MFKTSEATTEELETAINELEQLQKDRKKEINTNVLSFVSGNEIIKKLGELKREYKKREGDL